MSTPSPADQRADRIAARATGLGVGLIAFMLTWTIAARITERLLDAPSSAYAAMATALVVGAVATLRVGHQLAFRVQTLDPEPRAIAKSSSRSANHAGFRGNRGL